MKFDLLIAFFVPFYGCIAFIMRCLTLFVSVKRKKFLHILLIVIPQNVTLDFASNTFRAQCRTEIQTLSAAIREDSFRISLWCLEKSAPFFFHRRMEMHLITRLALHVRSVDETTPDA